MTMTVVYVLCTALGAIAAFNIITWLVNRQRLHRIIDKIPGPKAYPIVGSLLGMRKVGPDDRFKWFNNLANQYKEGIFRIWLGEKPFVQLAKSKCVDEILRSGEIIEKSQSYRFLRIWLGSGLLLSSGEKWHRHRKMISPTFHLGILEEFSKVMSEKADIFNRCVEEEIKKNPGQPLDVFDMLTRFALDVICESAMGIESNTQTSQQTDYTRALANMTELIAERILQPWLHWDWIYYRTSKGKRFKQSVDLAHEFTDRVIQERKQALQKEKLTRQDSVSDTPKRKAFLDHLLEACEDGVKLTDEELRHEVDTFTFAGHDTTSTAMSFALFSIGNDPKVQNKLDEEFQLVFGDSKEPAAFQDLNKLKYLERVIKETLRLYPSVANVSRRIPRDTEIGGYKVPANTTVTINIFNIHRDPENWPDPKKFDPDRFLPENSQERHPYAYVPFSAGPRNCIGQKYAMLESKIALTAILRKWRVKSQLKHDELLIRSEIVLKSPKGVMIYFTPK